jgi:hypothetical protein
VRSRSYLDFDLLIERGRGEHAYQARVVEAPSGPTQPAEFVLPFSDLELENFLLKIGRPRRETGRSLGTSQAAAIETFGEALFSSVFSGDLKVTLATSLAQADSEDVGLRLRLRLTDVPELANIPWEFLRDPAERRFLALSEWTPLVRYLELPGRQRPLTVSPPLRILVVVASPIDLVRLDAPAELARLREALGALERSGKVVVDAAPAGTLSALSRKLRRGDYHVFHFIGHGGYDAGEDDGLVAFEDADGRFQQVRASHLAMLLHDHRTLRMAVLNSCEGARGSLSDPYAGTAQTLVRQGVPAVVAMQFEITDDAAIAFSQTLYEAIADGYPVDAAMAQARLSICSDVNDVEWATPVLYLRAPDGRIFDVVAAPVTESPSPASDLAVLADDPAYAASLVETKAGRWHEVVRLLVDVEMRFPGEEVVAEQLKNARRQLQLAMLEIRAESAARDERWNDTQFALERIVEIDPAYAGAADRLMEIRARPEPTPTPQAPGAPPHGPEPDQPSAHPDGEEPPSGSRVRTVISDTPSRWTGKRRRKVALLGAALVVLVSIGLTAAYLRHPSQSPRLGDEWILYTGPGAEGSRLTAVSSLTGATKPISTKGAADVASISRDRRTIAYVRVRAGKSRHSAGPLRLVTLDGREAPLFERDKACGLGRQRVSWGPGDDQIAERCFGQTESLWVRDRSGGMTQHADGLTRNPTFSPDGKFVMFWRPQVRGEPPGAAGLFAMSVGREPNVGAVRATDGGAPATSAFLFDPAWSPNPSSPYRLAVVGHPKGDPSDTTLYTATFTPSGAGGGTLGSLVRVLHEPDLSSPTWSPNGTQIAFQQAIRQAIQICFMSVARAESPHCPVQVSTRLGAPVWSSF